MSIVARIWLAIFALILPMLVLVGVFTIASEQVTQEATTVRDQDVPAAFLYAQILEEVDDLQENVTEFMHGRSEELRDFEANKAEIEGYWAQLEPIEAQDIHLLEIKTLVDQYTQSVEDLVFDVYSPEEEQLAIDLTADVEQNLEQVLEMVRTSADVISVREESDAARQLRWHIDLEYSAGEMNTSISEYVGGEAAERQVFLRSSQEFQRQLESVRLLTTDEGQLERLDQIEVLHAAAARDGREIFDTFDPQDKTIALSTTDRLESGLFLRLGDVLEEASIEENQDAAIALDSVVASNEQLSAMFIIGAAVAVIVGVALATIAVRSVAASIDSVVEVSDSIAEGSFDLTADEVETSPDFRQLYDALFGMVDELQRQQARAEAASQSKSDFLANVAHEIRTPLNSVLGHSQLLAQSTTLDGQQREHVEAVMRSGEALLNLINDVMDMRSIEEGKIEVSSSEIAVRHTFDALDSMLHHAARQADLELKFEVDPSVPQVIVQDGKKLQQILVNLVNNAIKFTDEGSVTTRAWVARGELRISVTDTGPGIEPEAAERIFRRFERNADAESEGTGLGLSISSQYAEAMGGHLELIDLDKPGATFLLRLPFQSVATPSPQSGPTMSSSEPVTTLGSGSSDRFLGRVQLVDDNEENRLVLRSVLQRGSTLQLEEFIDGESSVAACTTEMPDVIFMDIRMPGMGGMKAVKAIREMPGGDHPVIIMVTASALRGEERKALTSGADGFVAKPIEVAKLWAVIDEVCDVAQPASPTPVEPQPGQLAQSLRALSDEDRDRLVAGLRTLAIDEISEVVNDLPLCDESRRELEQAATDFRYEELLGLLDADDHEAVGG